MEYEDITDTLFNKDIPVNKEFEKSFYPNGILKTFGFYRNGAPIGKQTQFYENGLFHKIIPYSAESRKAGVCIYYKKRDTLSYTESYDSSGYPHGVFHKLECFSPCHRLIKKSFHMNHGVPRKWLTTTWWKDINIHWIHYKDYHMILSFYSGGKIPYFSIKLYMRSSAEDSGTYIFYENISFVKEFHLITPTTQTTSLTPYDSYYKKRKTPITIIYLTELEYWDKILMKHGPFTDEYMADDILSTIEEEGDVRAGLDRYLTNYGVAPKFGSYQIRNFIESFIRQAEV
jgi:hypothetical protein